MMKKNSRKGFTLAELLIVIAILAILIAIAIPAFSVGMDSAKLATDHSNLRSVYSVYQTCKMSNSINISAGTSGETEDIPTKDTVYWFMSDGRFAKVEGGSLELPNDASYYYLKTTGKDTDCKKSVACKNSEGAYDRHKEGGAIYIHYNPSAAAGKKWTMGIAVPTT